MARGRSLGCAKTAWSRLPRVVVGDKTDSQQREAHEPGSYELDERDAEVTHAGLDAEGCTGHPLGEEIAGGGHETGEHATAHAGDEGQHQEPPVRSGGVLYCEKPSEHRDDEKERGQRDQLAGADDGGQEHEYQSEQSAG